MAHCTLIYPGLLGPDVPLAELPADEWPDKAALPGLSLLLNRAKADVVARRSLEQQILNALGYIIPPGAELPIANLRQASAANSDAHMWCLDPVYVQLDREMAYLGATDELSLTEAEAQQLIASINQHFADELHIRFHTSQQWLLSAELQLSTHTPTEALLQDISPMLPQGEDAQRWRSRVTEIQMLLHNHPVNDARVAAGKLPVNSVWLWGGGTLELAKTDVDIVYADNVVVSDAAAGNAITYAALPEKIEATFPEGQNVLLVLTDQLHSIQQKDVYAWLAALKAFDARFLSPLLSLLKTGSLERLQVESENVSLSLNKRDLVKWWRRSKNLQNKILELRNTCDG